MFVVAGSESNRPISFLRAEYKEALRVARNYKRGEMPTPPDSTGRPSSAKSAVPGASSSDAAQAKPSPSNDLTGELPIQARSGSTDSHRPEDANSDFFLNGSSVRRTPESDIAQFLAQPQNTDDSPTVITQGNQANANLTVRPLPVVGEAPSIAGRRLGHFELIEAVGAGGMAAVLKARDTELSRIVALKILPPDAARDLESVNRFKQEARAAAALDHENIARVYYCGEDQGLHFIAFEFVEGINLRQMIDLRRVLSAAECVRYMMQIAAGLNHAAERGVVHRDIKPSNILITPDGRAKIVDMGLARHLGSELVNGGVTQSGVTLGTFDYISPEQALDPRRADVRSDIYSLGCTFYHALTGRPPVPEGTAARKLRAHQNEQPLDPRELNPAIPDEVAALLGRMMAKDPADRYQTPMELIAHLKGLAQRLNLSTDALAHDLAAKSVPADTRLLPELPRFHPLWVLAFVAVAIAAVAFVIATSNPGSAPGPIPPEQTKKLPEPSFGDGKGPKTFNAGATESVTVTTAKELAQQLEDPTTTKVILAAEKFDLTKLDKPVEFHGNSLELVGLRGGLTQIIVVASPNRTAPGSFTLNASDSISVQNVKFDQRLDPAIVAAGDAVGVTKPVGLRIDDAAAVEFTDCVFTADDDLKSHEVRSVAIARDGCEIKVVRCLFAPNAVGMDIPAGSIVNVSDSGFAPHLAVFHITDPITKDPKPTSEPKPTVFDFEHATFMLDPGGSVVETGTAKVHITAADCLFAPVHSLTARSQLFPASEANRRGVVLRTRGERTDGLELHARTGHANAYYSIDPFGTSKSTIAFAEAGEIKSDGFKVLKQMPWFEEKPLTPIASLNPWKAFKLKVEGPGEVDPAIFATEVTTGGKERLIPRGVAFAHANAIRAYPDLTTVWGAFAPPKKTNEPRKLVWYPKAPLEESSPLVHSNLGALLDHVRPGEEILIRHDGELPLNTTELKPRTKPSDGEFKVTFRAYDKCKPVLTVDPDTTLDQTLFKLVAGEVAFEGIHFRLVPDQPKFKQTVAAVGLLGGKSCTFKNCIFTLADEDIARSAAVHLPNIGEQMAMTTTARQTPQVKFENCLIRGKGRGVWAQVGRSFTLEMTDTLTALDGPVIFTEAGSAEMSNGHSTAKFLRVTSLVGGPIVEMRGGTTTDTMRPGGLAKLEVNADACLFVAVPSAGRPLVDIEGIDPTDWKSVLEWHVPNAANRYANFDTSASLATIKPSGEGMIKEWSRTNWIDNTGERPPEAVKRFGDITFDTQMTGLKDLASVKPSDMVVKSFNFADLNGTMAIEEGVKPNDLDKLKP